jgi:hypothetical protein
MAANPTTTTSFKYSSAGYGRLGAGYEKRLKSTPQVPMSRGERIPLVSRRFIAVLAIKKAARPTAAKHRVTRPMQMDRHTSSSIPLITAHASATLCQHPFAAPA